MQLLVILMPSEDALISRERQIEALRR